MVELFWDAGGGGFFMSSSPDVLVRVKEGYDGPTPSGNCRRRARRSCASPSSRDQDFREKAETTLKVFGDSMESTPHSHT